MFDLGQNLTLLLRNVFIKQSFIGQISTVTKNLDLH